jgi:hypothetical protein
VTYVESRGQRTAMTVGTTNSSARHSGLWEREKRDVWLSGYTCREWNTRTIRPFRDHHLAQPLSRHRSHSIHQLCMFVRLYRHSLSFAVKKAHKASWALTPTLSPMPYPHVPRSCSPPIDLITELCYHGIGSMVPTFHSHTHRRC